MILVSRQAPDFIATAIMKNGKIVNDFNFYQSTMNKYVVIFFWPMDFTFVCPSEIISFSKKYEEFHKRNVEIIGISCDSVFVHNAWRNTPIEQGGIGKINYTMVSDIKKEIQRNYGIEHPSNGVALRGSFLIDKNKIVRHQVINDLPLGRNINEMIRMVDSLKFHEVSGDVCPAQWDVGKKSIKPSTKGIAEYLSKNLKSL